MIRLENINFKYDEEIILKDINLKVNKGECLFLMGENGSGKTTLLKILNGLLLADSGNYYFNNELVNDKYLKDNIKSKEFHQKIGYVFQNSDAQLFNTSVYDEISFGLNQMNLDKEGIEKRTSDILDLFDLNKLKDRSPYTLSGGEKKKVAIGSILVTNPDILIMDEPLSSLDKKNEQWLIEFLNKLKLAGKTMIITTHDLNFALKISDRTLELNESHTLV